MKNKYDVIIIGSGIGGLTIASLLSKTKKVLILEKNRTFGGYCSDFKRNGFRFETAVQAINGLYQGNPINEILKKSKAFKNHEITRPKNLYKTKFPDHEIVVPQRNLGKYIKLLSVMFPSEKANIVNLFNEMKQIYFEMKRFYKEKSLKKSPYILKYSKLSLQALFDKFIDDKKLKAIIAQYWMYRGLPPSKFPAISFAYICYDYTVHGSYMPKHGTQALVANLVKTIQRNGGHVLCDKEVSALYASENKIIEIQTKNGDRFKSLSAVSNVDIFKTFDMLVNADTNDVKTFLDKLRGNTLSISAFKIYLGLSINIRKLGINDYEMFVNPSYDVEAMYQASVRNEFTAVPYSITVYSNLSDAFCKKDCTVLSIGSLSGYDFWNNLPRSEYKEKKEEMAEILITRCEKEIPNLRKYIKIKDIATPITMEKYTGNSQGSIYGWNKKSLVDEIRFMNPTTPIKNLFLASHWTKMGGGIGGVLLSSDRTYNLLKK